MGGGNTAMAEYPPWIVAMHQEWLFGATDLDPAATIAFDQSVITPSGGYHLNVMDEMVAASHFAGSNPYSNAAVTAFDPDETLQAAWDAIGEFADHMDGLGTEKFSDGALDTVLALFTGDPFATATYDETARINAAVALGIAAMNSGASSWFAPSIAVPIIAAPPGPDSATIDAAIAAHEANANAAFQRNISKISAGLWDVRAVMNSQFGATLALAAAAHADQLAAYEADLRGRAALQDQDHRQQVNMHQADLQAAANMREADIAAQSATSMVTTAMDADGRYAAIQADQERAKATAVTALYQTLVEGGLKERATWLAGRQANAQFQIEYALKKIVIKNDQMQMDLQLEIEDALWDLKLFQFGSGVMASIAGASAIPIKTEFDRMLEGIGGLATIGQFALGLGSILSSDRNIKEDIKPISDPLDRLRQVHGVDFRYTSDSGLGQQPKTGFIAQDVRDLNPDWVTTMRRGHLGIDAIPALMGLVAVQTEAIKVLADRLDRLEQTT